MNTAAHDIDKENDSTAPEPGSPKPRRQVWRYVRRFLAASLSLIIVLVLLLMWLLGTSSGLAFGLHHAAGWFGVHIRTENLAGSVWNGFSSGPLTIGTSGSSIAAEKFAFEWNHSELSNGLLHVRLLDIGRVRYLAKPHGEEPPASPAKLPESINLPMAVRIDKVVFGGLQTGTDHQTAIEGAELSYRYDHTRHRLDLSVLRVPDYLISGQITLNTATPFALSGRIDARGTGKSEAVRAGLMLSGSLKTPAISLNAGDGKSTLSARVVVQPFAEGLNRKIVSADINGSRINPAAYFSGLPAADITVLLQASAGKQDDIAGTLQLDNTKAAAFGSGSNSGIPLEHADGRFVIDNKGLFSLQPLDTRWTGKGRLVITGTADTVTEAVNLNAALTDMDTAALAGSTFPGRINGTLQATETYTRPRLQWTLAAPTFDTAGILHIRRRAGKTDTPTNDTAYLEHAVIKQKSGGSLTASGSLGLADAQVLALKLQSKAFDPSALERSFPKGRLDIDAAVSGNLAGNMLIKADMSTKNSMLSGAPLNGKAGITYGQDHLSRADVAITLGQNRLKTDGRFGKDGDRLNIDIAAPDLGLFGFGLKGVLNVKGFLSGAPERLTADLQASARNMNITGIASAQSLDVKLKGSPDITRPVDIKAVGRDIRIGTGKDPLRIGTVDAAVTGTGNRHSIRISGDVSAADNRFRINTAAAGGFDKQYQWKGRVSTLDIAGAFNLKLLSPLDFEAGPQRVSAGTARWAAMGGSLTLQNFRWESGKGLTTRGRADRLDVRQLNSLVVIPIEQNLILSGDWDFAYGNDMRGYVTLRQQSGDIILPVRKQALNLTNTSLDVRFQNGRINAALKGNTRYGSADAALAVAQNYGSNIMNAGLSGRIRLDTPALENIRNLLPVGTTIRGSAKAEATVGGTVGSPQLSGTLSGDNLYYREQDAGVILENGSLRSRFQGRRWLIDSLSFQRKDGTLKLKGFADFSGMTPDVDITADFDRYMVLDQINRRLTLSGTARMLYTVRYGVALTGGLKVDSGQFGFQNSGLPSLDDDVVVIGREKPVETGTIPVKLDLTLDLNNRFRFSGAGLDVVLGGKLTATMTEKQNLQVVGTVSIARGQYKAYGQDLVIQSGSTVSFVGPISDPTLKLRAVRRYSQVGAGIEALGTLNSPRINLVANESMSEKDKLSWLVLNRASSGSAGDEAALSTAVSAWLAGSLNDRLKLVDEIGITSQQTRDKQTGELNAAEQVITIGKRLTNDLYVGYQYGLTSSIQTVRLTYQINRSLQTILSAGTYSFGGEIRYSIRFD